MSHRLRTYTIVAVLTILGLAGVAGLGFAIITNFHNRRDINRIISPSPDAYKRGIDGAIAKLTPAQAAAIFRKLSPGVREELRGPAGRRGPQGPRGPAGGRGPVGGRGSPGPTGVTGRQGIPGPAPAPPTPRAPAPRVTPPRVPLLVPLIPPVPPAFPVGPGGAVTLPNGKPCPPRNPVCGG